jgi:hypothetical protein
LLFSLLVSWHAFVDSLHDTFSRCIIDMSHYSIASWKCYHHLLVGFVLLSWVVVSKSLQFSVSIFTRLFHLVFDIQINNNSLDCDPSFVQKTSHVSITFLQHLCKFLKLAQGIKLLICNELSVIGCSWFLLFLVFNGISKEKVASN